MTIARIVVVCAIAALANTNQIPDYIHVCRRSDPHVSKCVRESIEIIRPRLKNGIPELHVPAVEPLKIKSLEPVSQTNEGFYLTLKDVDVFGVSNFEIKKLKLDIPNITYRIGVKLPLLRLVGTYNVNARVLVVPIKGEGTFVANATECLGNAVLQGELINKNGKQYLKFTKLELKIQIGDYSLDLDNLFNGDPLLGKAAHDVLHENKKEFIEIAIPYIERQTSELLLEIANKIVETFPYNELFPEK